MTTTTLTQVLRKGDTGNGVTQLQRDLIQFFGLALRADGVFDDETERYVRRFQYACTINIDGVVGAETWCALDELVPYSTTYQTVLQQGSQGIVVKYLQARLNDYFYEYGIEGYQPLDCDGVWGTKTDGVVKRVQEREGLIVDGIVGRQTWTVIQRHVRFD